MKGLDGLNFRFQEQPGVSRSPDARNHLYVHMCAHSHVCKWLAHVLFPELKLE